MMTDKIKILMIKRGMTQKELAEKLNCSQANLSKKFKLDDWRESDLQEIAKTCNCKYDASFILEDNDRI